MSDPKLVTESQIPSLSWPSSTPLTPWYSPSTSVTEPTACPAPDVRSFRPPGAASGSDHSGQQRPLLRQPVSGSAGGARTPGPGTLPGGRRQLEGIPQQLSDPVLGSPDGPSHPMVTSDRPSDPLVASDSPSNPMVASDSPSDPMVASDSPLVPLVR